MITYLSKRFVSRLFLAFNKITGRKMADLPTVFVRNIDSEDKLKISFDFTYGPIDHVFTFLRPKNEKLGKTIVRMRLKMRHTIEEKMNRRLKKPKKKNPMEVASAVVLHETFPLISLCKSGVSSIDEETKNFDAWMNDTIVKIEDRTYRICSNPPTILNMTLPTSIMSGFMVYPILELEFCQRNDCQFSWFRSQDRSEASTIATSEAVVKGGNSIEKVDANDWSEISNDFCYVTTEADIGKRLKVECVPKSNELVGASMKVISENQVLPSPPKCPFEDRHLLTKETTNEEYFRCVSYNILADVYSSTDVAQNELFAHCPPEALAFEYRKQLYLKEIIGYNADIICLQEVDRKVFSEHLVPVLSTSGLSGMYSEKGGQVIEGVACFYRTSKFKVIESRAVILCEAVEDDPCLLMIKTKLAENEKLKERFMTRTSALQTVLLESIANPGKRILVANTHLFFHPESDNIRLIQGAACILYLENLLFEYKVENASVSTSLVFSGDFNSSPDCGIYELATTGCLSKDCKDWGSNPEELVSGIGFNHRLSLASAYGTPQYTNFTVGFNGCLDYIYYDKDNLEVMEKVPLPTHEQVIEFKALPNKVFPSDHLALVCTFKWTL